MKKGICLAIILFLVAGCGSKKMKSESENSGVDSAAALETESGVAIFMKNNKEVARLDIKDTENGIHATFKPINLSKGRYVLKIEEACYSPARSKTELPRKKFKLELGQLTVGTGITEAEFSKPGLSIGDRHIIIGEKSVRLYKKTGRGSLTAISCAKITKR